MSLLAMWQPITVVAYNELASYPGTLLQARNLLLEAAVLLHEF
jgi:hypothetical protein